MTDPSNITDKTPVDHDGPKPTDEVAQDPAQEVVEATTLEATGETGTPSDEDADAALKKARKEAADRRVAARKAQEETEAVRAELESTKKRLDLVQDRWLAEKLYTTGVGVDAFKAAGHGAHSVLDDAGNIDARKFAEAVTDTASRFGRIGRVGGVIPSAGTGNPIPNPEHSWASVIKDA